MFRITAIAPRGSITILTLLLSACQAIIVLPKGNGTYETRITTAKLVDKMRIDPFAPDGRSRAIMVSVFEPVKSASECDPLQTLEYMPPATAQIEDGRLIEYGVANGTLERFGIESCRQRAPSATSSNPNDFPIIVFSPGSTASRLVYNAIAQSVASFGYMVVTIDHPYDAKVVEFPDGSLVLGTSNVSTTAQSDFAIAVRAKDASFVLDQLSAVDTAKVLIPGAVRGFNVSRVAMFGHSFGGATTAAAMLADDRIVGGVNLDGTLYGPVVQQGLDRPLLFLSHPIGRSNCPELCDPSWIEIWSQLRGWKHDLTLAGSRHRTFTDYPLLLKLLGLGPFTANSTIGPVLGTIDGGRAFEIETVYLVAFFDFVLKTGKEPGILQRPSPLYPEVSFVH